MRAVKDVEEGCAILLAFCAQEGVNLCHVLVGVQSLGEPALVGDEHHLEACVTSGPKRLHHGGQDREFGQVPRVIAGIVVDHAIAVEEEAGSQAHCANLTCQAEPDPSGRNNF